MLQDEEKIFLYFMFPAAGIIFLIRTRGLLSDYRPRKLNYLIADS
ncbi:hypothetical protein NC652_015974 [Populus alba x Populus x berolinensis]|nr:hypothetical protein NC652_015974 [Populus alba x Populus x berolinensis]